MNPRLSVMRCIVSRPIAALQFWKRSRTVPYSIVYSCRDAVRAVEKANVRIDGEGELLLPNQSVIGGHFQHFQELGTKRSLLCMS